jgi:hypothetical protein
MKVYVTARQDQSLSLRRIISRLPGFLRSRILDSCPDRTSLLKKGFIIWWKPKFRQILKEWLIEAVPHFRGFTYST